eukprot:6476548-Amphidinium_carterae.1
MGLRFCCQVHMLCTFGRHYNVLLVVLPALSACGLEPCPVFYHVSNRARTTRFVHVAIGP